MNLIELSTLHFQVQILTIMETQAGMVRSVMPAKVEEVRHVRALVERFHFSGCSY